jgi:hypothetical protein
MKILDQLNAQIAREGMTQDMELVLCAYNACQKSAVTWGGLVSTQWVGPHPYTPRYVPTAILRSLAHQIKQLGITG